MSREYRSIIDLLSSDTVVPLGTLQSSAPPKMSQSEFVANAGAACPHCGSPDISGGGLSARMGPAIQSVWGCETCGNEWIATFRLSGFIAGTPRREEPA